MRCVFVQWHWSFDNLFLYLAIVADNIPSEEFLLLKIPANTPFSIITMLIVATIDGNSSSVVVGHA